MIFYCKLQGVHLDKKGCERNLLYNLYIIVVSNMTKKIITFFFLLKCLTQLYPLVKLKSTFAPPLVDGGVVPPSLTPSLFLLTTEGHC